MMPCGHGRVVVIPSVGMHMLGIGGLIPKAESHALKIKLAQAWLGHDERNDGLRMTISGDHVVTFKR